MLSCNFFCSESLLHAVFVGLDHLFDHLTADGTGLAAGELAVVAVLQIDADFRSGFHLELVHGLASGGIDQMIAVTGRHSLHLLFSIRVVCPQLFFANEHDIYSATAGKISRRIIIDNICFCFTFFRNLIDIKG